MTAIPPIREYLLQQLSGAERERMEELLFESDAFFDQVRAEEESLLDEYLQGEISATDRESFEQRLALSAELQERVLLRKAFLTALDQPKEISSIRASRRTRWVAMLTMAATGALAASLVFTVILIEKRRDPQQAPAQSSSAGMTALSKSSAPEAPGTVIFLASLETRGEATVPVFHVPRQQSIVEIQVQLPTQPAHRSSLQMTVRSGDRIIFQMTQIKPRSAGSVVYVSAYLPSETLSPGIYQVDVTSDLELAETCVRKFEISTSQ